VWLAQGLPLGLRQLGLVLEQACLPHSMETRVAIPVKVCHCGVCLLVETMITLRETTTISSKSSFELFYNRNE
jgi:hypothetical protein